MPWQEGYLLIVIWVVSMSVTGFEEPSCPHSLRGGEGCSEVPKEQCRASLPSLAAACQKESAVEADCTEWAVQAAEKKHL